MSFLPEKWKYDGIVMSGYSQTLRARRAYEGGHLVVESPTQEGLGKLARQVDLKFFGDPDSHQITVSVQEMQKLTAANVHQAKQVTELQQKLTLKEEQLRAHRRAFSDLTEAQIYKIQDDVEKVTQEVLAKYKNTEGNQ